MRPWPALVPVAGLISLLAGVSTAVHAKVPVGQTAAVRIESPHPYPPGDGSRPIVWTHSLHHPDATFLKLHFARMAVGPGDLLRILDGQGRLVAEYTEHTARRPLWAPAVEGDTLTVELRADASGAAGGVVIDRYGYGTAQFFPESVCGSDQSQDLACFSGTAIETAGRAVGRMLFEANGGFFLCTGSLVSAQSHFLSNEHCVSTQASVDSLEVRFNYQSSACGGDVLAPFETFAGDQLIATHAGFDFALMTLQGGPAATYGFLRLSSREPVLNEALYVPPAPGQRPQEGVGD